MFSYLHFHLKIFDFSHFFIVWILQVISEHIIGFIYLDYVIIW